MLTLSEATGGVEVSPGDKLLIAHRGASAYAPEHTLAAYRLALEQGADFVEQDLQISRDGVLVCLHDPTLERTTNVEEVFPERFRETAEGSRVKRSWFVVDFTLEELKTLDAGSRFGPQFRGEQIATFQEAIDLVKGKAGLYPELKDVDFYREKGFRIEELLLEVLDRNGLARPADRTPVVIQSFHEEPLRRLRSELGSSLPRTYLFDELPGARGMSEQRLREIRGFAEGIGPNKKCILEDPGLVGRAHAAGLTVTPYTFRSKSVSGTFPDVQSEMRYFLYDLGVDALFTDNPDLFPHNPEARTRPPGP